MAAGKILSKTGTYLKKNWFNAGMTGLMAVSDYNESREEGNGIIHSALKAGASGAYYTFGGNAVIAMDAVKMLPGLAVSAYEGANQQIRSYEREARDQRPFQNPTFVDPGNPQIYTQRQAGMALAQRSRYSLQQAIMGNEAQYMHR